MTNDASVAAGSHPPADLFNDYPDAIVLEHEGVIAWASPRVRESLGADPPDLVGTTLDDLVQEDERGPLAVARRDTAEGPDATVLLHARVDGELMALEARLHRRRDAGDDSDVVVALRSLTDGAARKRDVEKIKPGIATIARRAGDLMAVVDGDGRIIEASDSAYEMLGWTARDMIGLALMSFVHPDDQVPLAAYRDDVQSDTAVGSIELRARTKGGTWRWFQMTALLLSAPGADAEDIRTAVTLRSIDELMRETRFAEREAARLRAILDSSLDPWLMMCPLRDRRGRIVDFVVEDTNDAACEYLRWPRGRLLGARIVREFPALVSHGLIESYAKAVDEGAPVVLHDLVYPHEVFGETRHYELRARSAAGSLLLTWRDTTADVTERGGNAAGGGAGFVARWAGDALMRVVDDAITWASPGARDLGLVQGSSFTASMAHVVSEESGPDVRTCAVMMAHEPGYVGRWNREGQPPLTVRARPAVDDDGGAVVTIIGEEWTDAASAAVQPGTGRGGSHA